MLVSRTFKFDAAHYLPNYDGPCKNVHGHTWKVEVAFSGPVIPETGMVIDFVVIKQLMNDPKETILPVLDHHYLNEVLGMPTAENISYWIFAKLSTIIKKTAKQFPNGWSHIVLEYVRVWESEDSYARFDKSDVV
jgi:6-pyruvoyltetrahydropterin/6-carboxytetrahydropterin synthase